MELIIANIRNQITMETEILQSLSLLILQMLSNIDSVNSLMCWQCIADNCDTDPSENYKATKRECPTDSYCQKVAYTFPRNNTILDESIVRGCSPSCSLKDSPANCTVDKRGCVRRHCCQDQDLCNGARKQTTRWPPWGFYLSSLIGWIVAYSACWRV